ncbi:hypothetical protein RC86_10875 [Pectobacterium brasiliense]|uniref:hypothetical protein n=1 Tax=Pectobacterium brasiliense TaxID=180957 RepID=UPI00057C3837|nr:hypothetical protein [Pectobacterium brasiliense]KHS91535.1 hypothetical protein RC86_10875 [Pectobacterium brasiliense]MDY4347623.1 hypothetical protein [Pectobacterium brasiliense]
MNTTVKIGNDEIVHAGVYLIPLSESNISIYMLETDYTFKISFEEVSEDSTNKDNFQRLKVIEANGNTANVLFSYRSKEKSFGSTKKPNNMFYSLKKSEGEDNVKIKVQYQFSIFVEINPKNSLRVNLQITKKPEEKQKGKIDE